jgi:hypothetical protein
MSGVSPAPPWGLGQVLQEGQQLESEFSKPSSPQCTLRCPGGLGLGARVGLRKPRFPSGASLPLALLWDLASLPIRLGGVSKA